MDQENEYEHLERIIDGQIANVTMLILLKLWCFDRARI